MTGLLPLDEYKTRAAILLKNLRSDDKSKAEEAALRFQILPFLAGLSPQTLLRATLKLKHALTVLALENGFDTWADLKRNVEYNDKRIAFRNRSYTSLYPKRVSMGFVNEWHAQYDEALAALQEIGGYLLPYKSHYFIVQDLYIEALGLDPDDMDWELIGWNWVKPADTEAWERLNEKLEMLETK
jgi:hypothetical protein